MGNSRVLKSKDNQITQKYKPGKHEGVDLVGKWYSSDYIVSHSAGEVVGLRTDYKTKDKSGHSYGNYVKVKHENGYYTLYAHLKYGSVPVKLKQKVGRGQIVGYMGETGHSTGVHLHFEVRNTKDVKIDPTPYLNADLPSSGGEKYTGEFPKLPKRGYFNKGDTGAEVKKVQKFINWATGSKLAIDGSYGPATIKAVKKFQGLGEVKLKQDGSYGKTTDTKAREFKK